MLSSTFVKDIMKKDVISMDESMSVQEAAEMMDKKNVGSIIVTRKNDPVGILTERDFVTKIAAEGRPLFTTISGVMSFPLTLIDVDETVWEAAELMKNKSIHKLPVQDGNKIVGIVTTTDIVRICSVGSDSEMRKLCDQILLRLKNSEYPKAR